MTIKVSSAKAKARNLQQRVRDTILKYAPSLEAGDVRSVAMGSPGEDVQLSPAARKLFPYNIECKAYARIATYEWYKQAAAHGGYEPLLVMKQDHGKPLVVVDADHFFKLQAAYNEAKVHSEPK